MIADPGMGLPQGAITQGLSNQEVMPDSPDSMAGQGMYRFDSLVNSINPNQAFMDPTTLAIMKSQHPDANLASSVMKSVRWLRKSVDGTFGDINTSLNNLQAKDNSQINMADVIELQMRAGSFTFVMSMTSNIVSKSTTHLDTLLKAQ